MRKLEVKKMPRGKCDRPGCDSISADWEIVRNNHIQWWYCLSCWMQQPDADTANYRPYKEGDGPFVDIDRKLNPIKCLAPTVIIGFTNVEEGGQCQEIIPQELYEQGVDKCPRHMPKDMWAILRKLLEGL